MENRREFLRKSMCFKVVCASETDPYRHIQAEGVDMSAGGVGIKLKQSISARGAVKLRITRPSYHDTFEVKGIVAWQTKPDNTGTVKAGIKFFDIPWNKIQPLLH